MSNFKFTEAEENVIYSLSIDLDSREISFHKFIKSIEQIINDRGEAWISVDEKLPDELKTVWLSNGKDWVSLGCLVCTNEGWHWAQSNGIMYLHNGEIVSECESDDLDVKLWHPLPSPPKTAKQ